MIPAYTVEVLGPGKGELYTSGKHLRSTYKNIAESFHNYCIDNCEDNNKSSSYEPN